MSANNKDQMSPDASPSEVSKLTGVRYVNNMPMYIVGGLMSVFLIVMVLVAVNRSEKQNHPTEVKEEKSSNTSIFAKEITGERTDGIIQPKVAALVAMPDLSAPPAPPKPGTPGAIAIARPGNLDVPLVPPIISSSQNQQLQSGPRDDELNRIRITKMQQLEEAVRAKTSVNVTVSRASPAGTGNNSTPMTRDEQLARLAAVRQQIDANTRDDPTAAYKARLAQIQGSGILTAGANSGSGTTPQLLQMAATGNNVAQFANTAQGDRWKLESQLEAPRSPYELRAGFVLPATLISGINSELQGQIMGQVAQNVYDTPTGKYLLIPQGSRLVGAYSSNVAYGQARVLVAWQRIIFPDGKAMDIGSMPGVDSAGYTGLKDQVNNHYFRLFSSAFLMSGVTAGISLSQPQQTTGTTNQTASSAMSEALGQQLGQVTAQLIAKNMSIAPTLEIRPGYRFNVMVTKDMSFSKPYKAFDY